MWHVWETGEVHTGVWWGDLTGRDNFEHEDADARIIFKRTLKKGDGEAWAGLIWLIIGTGDGRL
jgi:hypothetical protein